MSSDNASLHQKELNNIKKYFGFLSDRGYQFYSVVDYAGAHRAIRKMVFRHDDLLLQIYLELGSAEISIRSIYSSTSAFMDVGEIIYDLTGEKVVSNLFAGAGIYAGLLQKHLDAIEANVRNSSV